MRTPKSAHGIIGQTRILNYITEWQLIYHETLEISSTIRELTNSQLGGNIETRLHHQLSENLIKQCNLRVGTMKKFIYDHGNPYDVDISLVTGLRNFVTQIYTSNEVAHKFLNFFALTKARSVEFEKRVYFQQTGYICQIRQLSPIFSQWTISLQQKPRQAKNREMQSESYSHIQGQGWQC